MGSLPPLGVVPLRMHAQVVTRDRYGDPATAIRHQLVDTPTLGDDEVLLAVMAAGVDHTCVWSAQGPPVDQLHTRRHPDDGDTGFHIPGSDASGIVYAVGDEVDSVGIGDHVVVHPGQWNPDDPWVLKGSDEMLAPSARIWGYDTSFGALAQFARVQQHQVLPKAPHLTWEEAAASTAAGSAAYRMLFGWPGNAAVENDVVLIWGGTDGVAGQAVQLARLAGAVPITAVSSPDQGAFSLACGAESYVEMREFGHWGTPPPATDTRARQRWLHEVGRFSQAVRRASGANADPAIVLEHLGTPTIPTSTFVCRTGGMIAVNCSTTDFDAVVDLRHHWTPQKRLQGSRGANDTQAIAYNTLMLEGKLDPFLGSVAPFSEAPQLVSSMAHGTGAFGNATVLVGAATPGLGLYV